jgi:hypothetical protein
MSIYGGPDIVTDGLILRLQAANNKSYVGSGTSWKDLSGNGRNFTLVNSPTFSTVRKGKFIFGGTNQYANYTSPILVNRDQFTWSAFVKFNNMQPLRTTPYYQLYAENNQVWIAQYDNAVGIDLRQADNNTWFDGQGGFARGAQIGKNLICRNTWYNFAWTFNRYGNGGTSGQVKGYLNGQLVNTTNTLRTGDIINNSQPAQIGWWTSSTYFDGEMTAVSIYDRQLSDKEILDNYNSFGGKYYEDLSIYENVTYATNNSSTIYISNNGGKNVDMFKLGGTNSWDRQFYSTTGYTAPCTIEFRKEAGSTNNGASYAMIGWNVDPTANASYASIDYAAYPYQQNGYILYNNGSIINPSKTWNQNEKLYVVYNTDGTLKHYNGSSLLYSVNYGTGKTVYVDTSLYSNHNIYGGFASVRVRKQAWNGTAYV